MSALQNTESVKNVVEGGEELMNSLSMLSQLFGFGGQFNTGAELSQVDTVQWNLRWYLISNNRQLLAQSYVEHGIVQTLVDQPVDDAFRTGFHIKTGQLDGEQIEELEYYCEKHQVIEAVMQANKWARLFGGGAVFVNTSQDPATPLQFDRLKKNSPLEFYAIDMWELATPEVDNIGDPLSDMLDSLQFPDMEYYTLYGHQVHRSRIFPIVGKQAPSFIRPRLRGWGMSEIERLVRSLNQYLKNQDVIFELLDEAKIDVYRMKGFNDALINKEGTNRVATRIQMSNQLKNYNNALTMDISDEYEQKQINFAGLSDMLLQIRQGLASDVKMPVTKLFGVSSTGFNSGEDDIENYNSMVEGSVRSKVKFIIVDVLQIVCQKIFGFVPTDLKIEFKPLRILSAEQEENVKDKQFNRTIQSYSAGLSSAEETKDSINKASLLPVEIDEMAPALPGVDIQDDYKVPTSKEA